jgi:AcrR family transcriptional regulator
MVQNSPRPRGRPRAYDPDEALTKALATFWKAGYAGTSLDDLAAAMGMNKPSIYAGFGDKKALYLKAIELYRSMSRQSIGRTFAEHPGLEDGLRRVARGAIANYVSGDFGPRGCFLVGTAVTEAATEPEVKAALDSSIRELEDVFAERFRQGQAAGETTLPAAPKVLGHLMADTIYGCALRARGGATRSELESAADAAVRLYCGGQAR